MTNKEQARQFIAYLFGYLAAKDFDAMPVTEAGQYSLFVGSPDRGAVIMAEGASIFDWLHEATHYLCWLWFDGLRKDELTPAEEHRAELAAYLPAAVLEVEGSAAARAWLNAAWETTAARARRIVFDSEVPLKAQMRRLIDGA